VSSFARYLQTMVASLLIVLFSLAPAGADEKAYRKALAEAVRTAANRVLPSIVTIEIIAASAGDDQGEVEQDAPTSGIVIDELGHVLASSIVVRRPSASILVVQPDGTRQTAKVVARDHHRELVLLKTQPNQTLVPVQIPEQLNLQIGQTCIVVGRYGSDSAPLVSRGVLSGVERLDGIALQTDARVSPSFYGGPLIDLYGTFLGVLIPAVAEGGAEDATSWYDSGIAFAIPTDVIRNKLERMKAGEDIKNGLVGIVAKSKDLNDANTEIAAVRSRSPAEAAGIKAGDVVLQVSGTPVRRHQEIRQVLGRFDAGEVVGIKLKRGDQELDVQVTLAETIPPLNPQRLGVVVREQAMPDAKDDDKERLVVVDAVLPDSPAFEQLKPSDVITKIGQAAITSAESLRKQMISAEADKQISVTYLRDDKEATLELTPATVAGKIFVSSPQTWDEPSADPWTVQEISLPDTANKAAYVSPGPEAKTDQLGLLVFLLSPGESEPQEALKSWAEAAQQAGVVVCAIAPEDSQRWQPKELDSVAKFAVAVAKKSAIEPTAVAVAAEGALADGKSSAADSMALAVAISQSKTFFGAALATDTRPPAVRLRENEASSSLQIMMPIETETELPDWSSAIKDVGYPIIRGGKVDRNTLLRWVRLLQSI
jgi:S1-C subfamily serine protease